MAVEKYDMTPLKSLSEMLCITNASYFSSFNLDNAK